MSHVKKAYCIFLIISGLSLKHQYSLFLFPKEVDEMEKNWLKTIPSSVVMNGIKVEFIDSQESLFTIFRLLGPKFYFT